MQNIKKLSALFLAVVMLLSFTACHKKGEIAVKIGNYKFSSAYYMCALMSADSEARTKVDNEENKGADSSAAATSSEINYSKKKIDGKKFDKWVKDTAMESLKEIAAYKTLCKKYDLKIDDQTKEQAGYYAEYYWSQYGYSAYYEPNGVSKETYSEYAMDAYYANLYFEYLYGAEGEKAISTDEVNKAMDENYVLVDMIQSDLSEKSEEEIAEEKTKLQGYADQINAGTMTFADAKKDHDGSTEEDNAVTDETDSDVKKPLDENSTVLGAEDTDYESPYFTDAKAMTVGEAKVVELKDGTGMALVLRLAVLDDPYYVENLDLITRHFLKDDEFEKDVKKFAKTLKVTEYKYAMNQFKVKKIEYPSSNQTATY